LSTKLATDASSAADSASRLMIVIATYNERENLPTLVERLRQVAPQATLLIIDDNSPDGTGQWAEERGQSDTQVRVVHRSGKQGLGSAILLAMRAAIAENFDLLLNLDADWSHPPDAIPDLLAGMRQHDVMIGSRYIPGGGTAGWPWHRRLMSRAVNWYSRWALRLPTRDCSGGYRCFRTATLAKLDLSRIRSSGYSFHEELLWHLKRTGASFGETPILFVDRRFGSSKINLREAFTALWVIFRLGCREWLLPAPRR
jgi:dolichol-phosphate mannosyltransferase